MAKKGVTRGVSVEMRRAQNRCDCCELTNGRHAAGCRRQITDATTSRWRYLESGQREAALASLRREHRRLMSCADRARAKATSPDPFGSYHYTVSLEHAAKAGACLILIEMLDAIGGHP
jgi:hypothetical protein